MEGRRDDDCDVGAIHNGQYWSVGRGHISFTGDYTKNTALCQPTQPCRAHRDSIFDIYFVHFTETSLIISVPVLIASKKSQRGVTRLAGRVLVADGVFASPLRKLLLYPAFFFCGSGPRLEIGQGPIQ